MVFRLYSSVRVSIFQILYIRFFIWRNRMLLIKLCKTKRNSYKITYNSHFSSSLSSLLLSLLEYKGNANNVFIIHNVIIGSPHLFSSPFLFKLLITDYACVVFYYYNLNYYYFRFSHSCFCFVSYSPFSYWLLFRLFYLWSVFLNLLMFHLLLWLRF